MKKKRSKYLPFVLLFSLLLMSCGTPYQPEEKEESEEIAKTDEVPPDGILETVTWNLNWYGADFNGPSDQELQTKNIIQVIDSRS